MKLRNGQWYMFIVQYARMRQIRGQTESKFSLHQIHTKLVSQSKRFLAY